MEVADSDKSMEGMTMKYKGLFIGPASSMCSDQPHARTPGQQTHLPLVSFESRGLTNAMLPGPIYVLGTEQELGGKSAAFLEPLGW